VFVAVFFRFFCLQSHVVVQTFTGPALVNTLGFFGRDNSLWPFLCTRPPVALSTFNALVLDELSRRCDWTVRT